MRNESGSDSFFSKLMTLFGIYYKNNIEEAIFRKTLVKVV